MQTPLHGLHHLTLEPQITLCPYCFQPLDLDLAPESSGVLTQDCDVCCNPLRLELRRSLDGEQLIEVFREND